MIDDSPYGGKHVVVDSSLNTYSLPFLFLCLFALLRPIFSLGYFAELSVFGLTSMEIFGSAVSCLLVFAALLRFNSLKLDLPSALFICFISYVILSFVWGANPRECIRFALPFFMYFSARAILVQEQQVKIIAFLVVLAFIYPILGSAFLISVGKSISMEIYQTGVIRYKGLYLKTHNLAHSMMVFIFFAAIFGELTSTEGISKRIIHFFLVALVVLAIYNIYKSVTRTVFLGVGAYTFMYLIGRKKYLLLSTLAVLVISKLVTSSHAHLLLFDLIEPLSGQSSWRLMGSGRLGGWYDILSGFLSQPLEIQFLGIGIGNEARETFGGSHSDWVSLYVSLGIFGVLIYSALFAAIFIDIARSKLTRRIRFMYIGFILSIFVMNATSNSYLSRFDLSQYFCLIIAMYYCSKEGHQGVESSFHPVLSQALPISEESR